MPYDYAIDTWSVGCTLFELYTGKILFTGRTNNQMLRSIMECRGKFSHKILRKAQFAGLHFDDLLNFRSVETDKMSGKVRTPSLRSSAHSPVAFRVCDESTTDPFDLRTSFAFSTSPNRPVICGRD